MFHSFDPFFDSAELGVIDDTERLKAEIIQQLIVVITKKEALKI